MVPDRRAAGGQEDIAAARAVGQGAQFAGFVSGNADIHRFRALGRDEGAER